MKKHQEGRLGELESRLDEHSSVEAETEKLRAFVSDLNASIDSRLNELQQQVMQDTDDKCRRVEKVRTTA